MDSMENTFSEHLLQIINNIVLTEEKALTKGYFEDLSVAELHTLDAVGPYEEKTMTEIAKLLKITIGTLSVAVERLVKKGYVQRRKDENDRRITRVSLTRSGKLAYRMHGKFRILLVRRIFSLLTPEKKEILVDMVKNIDLFLQEQYQKYEEQNLREARIDG